MNNKLKAKRKYVTDSRLKINVAITPRAQNELRNIQARLELELESPVSASWAINVALLSYNTRKEALSDSKAY